MIKEVSLKGIANVTRCPFNIRVSRARWLGAVGSHKGFVKFEYLTYGVRAGIILLRNYWRNEVDTIEAIVTRYAPSNENNTEAYIAFVCKIVGVPRYIPLTKDASILYSLCRALCLYESGYELSKRDFLDIVKQFNVQIP